MLLNLFGGDLTANWGDAGFYGQTSLWVSNSDGHCVTVVSIFSGYNCEVVRICCRCITEIAVEN